VFAFNTHKIRMIGLSCGQKNSDSMLSRFDRMPERDGQTDRIFLTRDKKWVI